MIYVLYKYDLTLVGRYDSKKTAIDILKAKEGGDTKDIEAKYIFLKEIGTDYISTIYKVDGKCVYKNKKWWIEEGQNLLIDFDSHNVIDVFGENVTDLDRYKREFYKNCEDIQAMDGLCGQVDYNINCGKEFVTILNLEYRLSKETNTLMFYSKIAPMVSMIQGGFIREAYNHLEEYSNELKDTFFTEDRIDKYIEMLKSCDAIDY